MSDHVMLEFLCPDHGRFESLELRASAPDEAPCPDCGATSPWTISAPMPRVMTAKVQAVTTGKSDPRPPGMLDTRPLAEGHRRMMVRLGTPRTPAPRTDIEAELAVMTDALQEGRSKEQLDALFVALGIDPSQVHIETTIDSETGMGWKRFRPGPPSIWTGIDRSIARPLLERRAGSSMVDAIARETEAAIAHWTERASRAYFGPAPRWTASIGHNLYQSLRAIGAVP